LARPVRAALLALVTSIVVACGNQAVTPPPTVAYGSPRPSVSLAPSPSPSPDPATKAIDAFVALVTTKGFSYQATFTGQDRHSTTILPISKGLLQVSGDDVLVQATFQFKDGYRGTSEHRWVNGKSWVKFDLSLGWKRIPIGPTETMGAFDSVRSAADVTLLDRVDSDGKKLYRIQIRSAVVNPVMIPSSNLTDTALTKPTLNVLIDASGRPVRGTAEINAKGRVSGQLQEIVIELTITFTKVGQAVSIKAP